MFKLRSVFKHQIARVPWMMDRDVADDFLPPDSVWAVSWSPDGRRLASAHADFAVRIWDVEHNLDDPVAVLAHEKFVIAVAWSPDGRRLASADAQGNVIRIWDVDHETEIKSLYFHAGWPHTLAWSRDARLLISGGQDGRVLFTDTRSWQVKREIRWIKGVIVTDITFCPGDGLMSINTASGRLYIADHGAVRLLNTTKSSGLIGSAASWYDNHRVAVAHDDGRITVWDTAAWRCVGMLPAHQDCPKRGRFRSVSWCANGRDVAAVGGSSAVRIWHRGQPLPPLNGHEGEVQVAKWSPGGRFLATGGDDGTVHVWMRSE